MYFSLPVLLYLAQKAKIGIFLIGAIISNILFAFIFTVNFTEYKMSVYIDKSKRKLYEELLCQSCSLAEKILLKNVIIHIANLQAKKAAANNDLKHNRMRLVDSSSDWNGLLTYYCQNLEEDAKNFAELMRDGRDCALNISLTELYELAIGNQIVPFADFSFDNHIPMNYQERLTEIKESFGVNSSLFQKTLYLKRRLILDKQVAASSEYKQKIYDHINSKATALGVTTQQDYDDKLAEMVIDSQFTNISVTELREQLLDYALCGFYLKLQKM